MRRDDRHPGAPELSDQPDRAALEATWDALAGESEWTSVEGNVPEIGPEATDAAWTRLSETLFSDLSATGDAPVPVETARTATVRPIRRVAAWGSVAAAAAVVAVSLVPVTRSAQPGDALAVVLPEGSTVELSGGSSLSWRRGFGWIPGIPSGDRAVTLDGEAFFQVTHDGTRFSVLTRDARVTVLGTRFNVRSLPHAPTRVTVEEGRVAVSHRDGRGRIELAAGQGAGLGADGAVVLDPVPDLRDLAWRSGGLTLRDLTADGIVDALERRFGVPIELRVEAPDDERLTLHYSQRVELETVLADLAAARGWTAHRTAEGWELVRE